MPRFAYYLLCLLVALLPLQGSAALLAACPQEGAAQTAQAVAHADHCAGEPEAQEQSPEASCAGSLACCAAACMPMTVWSGHPEAHVTAIPTARELPIHSVVPAMLERPPRFNG